MEKSEKKNPRRAFYKSNGVCELCDFKTSNLKDFNRHLATRKHQKNFLQISKNEKMVCVEAEQKASKIKKNQQNPSLLTQNSSNFFTNKKPQNFSCEHCRREFTYQSWLCRHYKTCKMQNKITNKKTPYHCALCNKDFTYKKSFTKHYTKCSKQNNTITSSKIDKETKIMEMLVESNKTTKELCEKVLKLENLHWLPLQKLVQPEKLRSDLEK